MKTSATGLDLIKRFEGCELSAYRCPANVVTIGYGSTGAHVQMGMTITRDEADKLLAKDLGRFEHVVNAAGGKMTQGQFDALTALSFNIGTKALLNSTLMRKHAAGDYAGAAKEFARWSKAAGKTLAGLVTRRAAEAALYASHEASERKAA